MTRVRVVIRANVYRRMIVLIKRSVIGHSRVNFNNVQDILGGYFRPLVHFRASNILVLILAINFWGLYSRVVLVGPIEPFRTPRATRVVLGLIARNVAIARRRGTFVLLVNPQRRSLRSGVNLAEVYTHVGCGSTVPILVVVSGRINRVPFYEL